MQMDIVLGQSGQERSSKGWPSMRSTRLLQSRTLDIRMLTPLDITEYSSTRRKCVSSSSPVRLELCLILKSFHPRCSLATETAFAAHRAICTENTQYLAWT